MALTEQTAITAFDIQPTGIINLRTTTRILRDGELVAETHARRILQVNDSEAEAVLGAEPFYFALAQQAWAQVQPQVPKPEADA